MLRLLEQLHYTPPKLRPYKKDRLEVTYNQVEEYFQLFVDGEEWMSYRNKDHKQAYEFYSHWDQARGHCICTGLGFGTRENWILTKPEVTKVTVIEKNEEVIEYQKIINPELFDHVEVIHADAAEYTGKCDTLLLDHFESEALHEYKLLQSMSDVCKNIESDVAWFWTLEQIIVKESYHRSRHLGRYVSNLLVYNEFKSRYNMPLPDLTEEDLMLYYFMYAPKDPASMFDRFFS
tara:strand:- start:1436 stop:2137 length:702 start_codon:yes stop_codon:yes gene_type:complete